MGISWESRVNSVGYGNTVGTLTLTILRDEGGNSVGAPWEYYTNVEGILL